MTSTGQAASLTNMFDPHIYACQSLNSGTTANSAIQSNENQQKVPTTNSSPQKSNQIHANSAIQTPGNSTPQRKRSQQEDGILRDIVVVAESTGHSEIVTTTHLTQNTGSGGSSTNNSRKTSTVSDNTPNDNTPDNSVLTSIAGHDVKEPQTITQTSVVDSNQAKPSPVRKLSRFLISPTVIETSNHELIVEEGTHAPASSPQQSEAQQPIEMNINEDNYQRIEAPETDLQPQQSTGFRMPETLEQLKIELENITHAHVSTKAKELLSAQQLLLQGAQNQDNEDTHDQVSEAQMESGAEYPSVEAAGSIATGDNTSVYNSRRTSADINTNPTDQSTASGVLDYEENLVSESVQLAVDDAAPKPAQPASQQANPEKYDDIAGDFERP